MNKLRIAVIGAGTRGRHLAEMLPKLPYSTEITAVCDIVPERCAALAPGAKHFSSYAGLFSGAGFDAVIIATLDCCHTEPLLAAMARDLPVLIEKPLTDKPADAEKIRRALETSKSRIAVCHTLRFLPAYKQLKRMVPLLGEVFHIAHEEAIGNIRFAHNYVRGQWGSTARNTHLFIHKCCHDVDYILSLLPEFSFYEVSSMGARTFFRPENAPENSTKRCHDCPHNRTCRFSAVTLYDEADKTRWPTSTASDTRTTLYGQCVFRCPNDVVDHQTAQLLIDGQTTFAISLSGFSAENGRRTRIQGALGELFFDEPARTIRHRDFDSGQVTTHPFPEQQGYHPEDEDIVREWLKNILHPAHPPVTVDVREALRTLKVVFDIEAARQTGNVIHS